MRDEFVPYELALRMKQLGFKEPCFCFYSPNSNLQLELFSKARFEIEDLNKGVLAPTWHSAFKWFRNKHRLFGYVMDNEGGDYYWGISKLFSGETEEDSSEGPFDESYEDAELACLTRLIEIFEELKSSRS